VPGLILNGSSWKGGAVPFCGKIYHDEE